jgi:hypothetical protein
MHTLLGGEGRMQVGNAEIVEFVVAPKAHYLKVSKPHQG